MEKSCKTPAWIPAFSGLRFLVIIFLCLHHFDTFNELQVAGWADIMRLFTEGYLSVNFFFILSGFVIQYSSGEKLQKGIINAKDFWFYRIAHLWPTYLLALTAALIVYASSNVFVHLTNIPFWCHVFALQSWIPDSYFAFQFNGAAWSVSTELFFYLMFPFLVQLKKRYRNILMLGIWGVVLLNIIVMKANSPIAGWIYYINPVFRLAEFLLGVFLCDMYKKGCFEPLDRKKATILECISILILICAVCIAMSTNIGWEWRWQVFYTIPTAILIYVFSFSRGYISIILGGKFARFLGELAFPIYLIHQICINIVKKVSILYLTDCSSIMLVGGLGIIISILLAIPIHFWFAKPLNHVLRKWWREHFQRNKCIIT